jgi:hypothetical protein
MKMFGYGAAFLFLVLAGCNNPQDAKGPQEKATVAVEGNLLKPLLLDKAVDDAVSVRDAKKAEAGKEITVRGKVPPGKGPIFARSVAGFILMDDADLKEEDVIAELNCDDAETCPACKELLDTRGVSVKLVDASGKVVETPVKGYEGIGANCEITVVGKKEVKKGKDGAEYTFINATRFYIHKKS